MKDHWPKVKELVGLLGYMVKDLDPDGIEMYYTMSTDKCLRSKETTKLISSIDRTTPKGISDISIRLDTILGKYKAKLQHAYRGGRWTKPRSDVRPLSLYVLTDGVWQPDCDVENTITDMVTTLLDLKIKSKKQIGIQFIRFGNDEDCKLRLEYLDSGLKQKINL